MLKALPLLPQQNKRNRCLLNFLISLLGTALIIASAQIDFSIPGTDIPQSAQTLAIVVCAALIARPYAILSVLLYLLLGAFGLPVFADGAYGWSHLIGSTGGYLLGFLVATIWLQTMFSAPRMMQQFLHFLTAHGMILLLGALWLSVSIGIEAAWQHGFRPFLLGAVVKSILALIIYQAINKFVAAYLAKTTSAQEAGDKHA